MADTARTDSPARLLTIRGVTKRYAPADDSAPGTGNSEGVHALRGVDLDLPCGRSMALLGPSGSGKSTLLQIAGLLTTPSSGTVELAGHAAERCDRTRLAELRAAHVGFVFQRFHLLPQLSATDNVALPLRLEGVPRAKRRARAREWLDRVGLKGREAHRPGQLSGGQQQRVALARALVREPDLVLADEPTGNLDSGAGAEIAELLLAIPSADRALLLVTHDEGLAARCDDVLRLLDGRVANEQA